MQSMNLREYETEIERYRDRQTERDAETSRKSKRQRENCIKFADNI